MVNPSMSEHARQLLRKAFNPELPFQALPAISSLRECLNALEHDAILYARSKGASLEDIAEVIGVSRQALHHRLSREGGSNTV